MGGEPVEPGPEAPRSRLLGHLAPAWLASGGKTALPRGEEDAQLHDKGVRTAAGHAAVVDRLLQLPGGECERVKSWDGMGWDGSSTRGALRAAVGEGWGMLFNRRKRVK